MALIKCKDCKNEFSSSAKACPHCGKRQTSFMTKMFAYTFAFIGIVTIFGIVSGNKQTEKAAQVEVERRAALTPEQRAQEDAEIAKQEMLSSVRGACLIVLKKSLNDPDSAQIGSTKTWYYSEKKDGTILVQPTARAKNAFGAYINGAWDCVVKPEGDKVRVISFTQIRP